ncbi:hypothetical protein BT69DRAFT_1215854, partial [Atractiella rhizophila]
SSFPLFDIIMRLREYLSDNPIIPTTESAPSITASASTFTPLAEINRSKLVLFWSHHLLATSKRKSIVDWCDELGLWGVAKPGYPGVILVEGKRDVLVDEFVNRIKRLQWKALQVRCEEHDRSTRLADEVKARTPTERPRSIEVETMGEMAELMKRAQLEDVFLTAMKLSK